MTNPLSKLSLDSWYHVLMVAGFCVFILSGAGILKSFPTIPTALISLGVFFIGLGEWRNHPLQTVLVPASAFHPAGTITGYPRKQGFIGTIFDLIGACLCVFGLFRLGS